MKITDEIVEYINQQHGIGFNRQQIAEKIFDEFGVNLSVRTVSRQFTGRIAKKSEIEKHSKFGEHLIEIDKNGKQTSTIDVQMNEEQAKDPDYVLRAHGFDSTKWEILSVKNNTWQQNSQENGLINLYQSKISVRPISGKMTADDIVKLFENEVKPVELKLENEQGENNLVLPLADIHFGITKIADLEVHLHKIIPILKKGYNIFVIEQLGDLFHSSQMWNTQTMRGTVLDEVDMVQAVEDAKTLFDIILKNVNAAKIVIKQIAGNHSGNMEYMFMEYLKAKYPDVKIDNNIKYRDAYLLGNIGIMMAHGDFAKKGLVSLFPNEFKKIWGAANQTYIHTGHFHTQKTTDEGGVVWNQFGTMKPNDKYEISNGWTLSKKSMYLIEYTKDELFAEYYV